MYDVRLRRDGVTFRVRWIKLAWLLLRARVARVFA
jgi:hypothetical protein